MPIEQLIAGEPEDPLPMSPALRGFNQSIQPVISTFRGAFAEHLPNVSNIKGLFDNAAKAVGETLKGITTIRGGLFTPGVSSFLKNGGENGVLKAVKR